MISLPFSYKIGDEIKAGDTIIAIWPDAAEFETITKVDPIPAGSGVVTGRADRTIVYQDGVVRTTSDDLRAWGIQAKIKVRAS